MNPRSIIIVLSCIAIAEFMHTRTVSPLVKLVIGLAVGVNSEMLVIIAVLIAVLIVLWWKKGL